MLSDGLVCVTVRCQPLVRTLCTVLQLVGEVGIGVCALSVWLMVVVCGCAYTSVTSSVSVPSPVSGLFSSLCVGSSPVRGLAVRGNREHLVLFRFSH